MRIGMSLITVSSLILNPILAGAYPILAGELRVEEKTDTHFFHYTLPCGKQTTTGITPS